MTNHPVHPMKKRARVLLTSVFGPYAQDDEYGSRKINPMELYQNQVTRFQGPFSLRMFHRSFGLMLIQINLDAPCSLLDFPSLDRFIREIRENTYDVVGIGSIIPNIGKVIQMCKLIRSHLPNASIVIGGHVTNKENIDRLVDADHIVKGDGVAWFRKYLGQDTSAPVHHPMAYSAYGMRILGITPPDKPGDTAAILIPSVGCPVGCNFCSTSALFGGKGSFINFYETGDALFEVMCRLEKQLNVQSFFIMDENFLLHRKRALRLLELMQANQKSWMMYVFSSARALKSYTIEQLVGLGVSWIWMGLEGKKSQYVKLNNVDTHELVRTLQSHGIRILGSSIIGLENHSPENMEQIIEDAIGYKTDFHQFMLYTPNAGTPLYEKHKVDGTLLDESEFSPADAHGQYRFNYRHRHIKNGQEEQFLHRAFQRDFEVNGPSLARLIRTQLAGWKKYRHHSDPRIRKRFEFEAKPLATAYAGAVWAMRQWYRKDAKMAGQMDVLLKDLYKAFGVKSRLIAPLAGRFLHITVKREQRRLANGYSYEPETFYEKNPAAIALEKTVCKAQTTTAVQARWVKCKIQSAANV
ncbi:MAG: B12-binding domain-containing radical SAM protein [Desulfobacteraceae bacterium]|nr:B12-binding domain-containing radical SAM protein [Desulfobacteraceae bacterium]